MILMGLFQHEILWIFAILLMMPMIRMYWEVLSPETVKILVYLCLPSVKAFAGLGHCKIHYQRATQGKWWNTRRRVNIALRSSVCVLQKQMASRSICQVILTQMSVIPHKANKLKALLASYCLHFNYIIRAGAWDQLCTSPGAHTADEADEASWESCAAQGTKLPGAEVQPENKKNIRA